LALGLANGKVALVESDPLWAAIYREEQSRLQQAIGALVAGIQHFGSTSISGIKAKPILDILVGLPRFADGPLLIEPLAALGYEYMGAEIVPDDHLFGLGDPRRHLLHAVEHDGYHWKRNLRFRDALRADRALATAYEALKVELAQRYPDSRKDYLLGKQAFIDRIADA
jgi:GrpB-like predicted nucleotidyltransferase (UPF0157 family)